MMLRLLLTILLFSLFLVCTKAQDGSTVSGDQIDYETNKQDSVTEIFQLERIFHVSLYIVKDISGNPGVVFPALETALNGLNMAYNEIGVTFTLSDTTYVNNYHFNSINKESSKQNMLTSQFHTGNQINLYLISNLRDGSEQNVCGYTYMPGDSLDFIFVRKDCLEPEIFARQFGHFFNLYNTHETSFGAEPVNGENCANTGDQVCDTPADPGLDGLVNSNCQYTGNAKDGDDYYIPHTTNYMSDAPLSCRCYFSEQQYLRMINAMVTVKSYLW
ncbi:MAG: hypothetical protein GVY19_12500 [Bacteroidetes bacterium]|nr:hypothetical protein [Bacteroidota bacterium]